MRCAFRRAIDSLFQRLGQTATYVPEQGCRQVLLVIARRPEQLFNLGEGELHAEQPQLMLRVSDKLQPYLGEHLIIDACVYRIAIEPRLDLHHLLWSLDCIRQDGLAC